MKHFTMLLALALTATLDPTTSSAQENPPERLDTVTLRHQVILHSLGTTGTSGRAVIWMSSGFGTVLLNDDALPRVWKLRDLSGNPRTYTWFRITSSENGSLDDYWFCELAAWDAFATSGNVAQLKASAWHFHHFHQSSDYTPPVLFEPVTWEDRSQHLTVGYTSDHTLVIVKRNNTTEGWEWSVRGPFGSSSWTTVGNKEAGKSAAQARLVGP